MTDYTVVYDPKGKMFEIPHERASQLVLNSGWSWKKPGKAEPAAPEPVKEEPVAPAPEPVIPEPAPAPAPEPDDHAEYVPPKSKPRLN